MHGIHVHGFPNVFVVGFTHGANLISNIPHNLIEAGKTIAAIVEHAEEVGADEVEVTAEAEAAWVELLEAGGRRFGNQPDCTPGYYNNEGQGRRPARCAQQPRLPGGPGRLLRVHRRWRSSGEFEGLEFRSA